MKLIKRSVKEVCTKCKNSIGIFVIKFKNGKEITRCIGCLTEMGIKEPYIELPKTESEVR